MYYIWVRHYKNGQLVGAAVYPRGYKRKRYAEQVARKKLSSDRDGHHYDWIVSETNPWRTKD